MFAALHRAATRRRKLPNWVAESKTTKQHSCTIMHSGCLTRQLSEHDQWAMCVAVSKNGWLGLRVGGRAGGRAGGQAWVDWWAGALVGGCSGNWGFSQPFHPSCPARGHRPSSPSRPSAARLSAASSSLHCASRTSAPCQAPTPPSRCHALRGRLAVIGRTATWASLLKSLLEQPQRHQLKLLQLQQLQWMHLKQQRVHLKQQGKQL